MRRTAAHGSSMSTYFKVLGGIGESFQQPLQYVDKRCQSILLLVLPVQGTLDENHILDVEKTRMMKMVAYRQGGQKSLTALRKPTYRSRNSSSPPPTKSSARTSSASSEEADVKSRETSSTRFKPRSTPPTIFRARASCASSSSAGSDEPQKSSRKKHDKGEAGSSHKADDLEDTFGDKKAAARLARQAVVGVPKALPNVVAKHLQTVVQEVPWRDNSSYGDSPKNRMHQGLDKWARNTYGKHVDHSNFF